MSGCSPEIDVLTVSRRPSSALVDRALRTQDYVGAVRNIVLIDGDQRSYQAWSRSPAARREVLFAARTDADQNGPQRLAFLRNQIIGRSVAPFVTFLDDDNCWERNHLSSLVKALDTCEAAHSERLLFREDGLPYLEEEFPWGRDKSHRLDVWRKYCELGVLARGSNRMRDRTGLPWSRIDLGEWLVPRDAATNAFEFQEQPTSWEAVEVEDHVFADKIESSLAVGSTQLATLHYRLGGYSNRYDAAASIYWSPPNGSILR